MQPAFFYLDFFQIYLPAFFSIQLVLKSAIDLDHPALFYLVDSRCSSTLWTSILQLFSLRPSWGKHYARREIMIRHFVTKVLRARGPGTQVWNFLRKILKIGYFLTLVTVSVWYILLDVVYFDQGLGAEHSKHWSKSNFSCFLHVFASFRCKIDKRWRKNEHFLNLFP